MTNELEKRFFQCFGIEPKFDRMLCDNDYQCNGECNNCEHQENDNKHKFYPQITDHILLELICILLSNNSPYMFKLGDWDVEKLKDTVLTMCIKLPDFLEWEDTSEYFKHQVRTLFEETK